MSVNKKTIKKVLNISDFVFVLLFLITFNHLITVNHKPSLRFKGQFPNIFYLFVIIWVGLFYSTCLISLIIVYESDYFMVVFKLTIYHKNLTN